jgi:uncharacterized protein YsxB (DUF464 family)
LKTVATIKDNFVAINYTVVEFIAGWTHAHTMENGNTIVCVDLEFLLGVMVNVIRDNLKMIKCMV